MDSQCGGAVAQDRHAAYPADRYARHLDIAGDLVTAASTSLPWARGTSNWRQCHLKGVDRVQECNRDRGGGVLVAG